MKCQRTFNFSKIRKIEAILNQDNRRKLLEAFDTHFLNKKGFMCKGSQVDKNNLKGGGKSNGKDSKGG